MPIDRSALRLALLYLLLGVAWILFSDKAMLALAPDLVIFSEIGLWKGMIFVLATAFGFYLAAARPAPDGSRPVGGAGRASGRQLVLVFALLAVVIVLFGLGGVASNANEQRKEAIGRIEAITDAKVEQVSAWLRERRADAQALAGNPALTGLYERWRAGDDGARTRLLEHLETFRGAGRYRSVRLLDQTGEPLLVTGKATATAPPAPAVQLALSRALAGGTAGTSELYRLAADTDELGLEFVAPVPTASGVPRLAVALQADARMQLFPLIQRWPVPSDTAETVLFRAEGDRVLYLSELRHRAAGAFAANDSLEHEDLLAAQAIRNRAALGKALEGHDYREVSVLGVARRIPDTDWFLLGKLDKSELYAKAKRDSAWIAGADTLALLMAAGAVLMLHQRRELRHVAEQRQAQAEKLRALHLLQSIAEGSSDAIYAKDRDGRYLLVNREAARRLDKTPEQVVGQIDGALFPPAEAAMLHKADQEVMARGERVSYEAELTTPAGPGTFLITKGPLRDPDGEVAGVFGVARDVTERKRVEDALRQAAMVFESTRDGVIITDLDEHILAVNRAFTEITGFSEAEALGQTPRILRSARQTPDFYQAMWSALLKTGSWQGEIWNRRRNGELFPQWMSISTVKDEYQRPSHYVAVFTDISQAKRNEAELEHLAHYDPLTDLPNRRLIQSRLDHAIDRAHRHGGRVGVLYLDLDRFKTVNDSLGHPAGDYLLTTVGRQFQRRLREEDSLGRLGGDEFLVILETLDSLDDAAVVARDLLGVLADPLTLPTGQEVYITASIGISVFPDDGQTSVELMRDADAAMYRAKENGRNQFRFCTGDMNVEARERLALEAALWRALERDELLLHYQPKVDLASGRIRGAEALLRWNRGGKEMVPPGQFIPLAERTGLIRSIGNWVIDAACRQIRVWLDAGMDDVAVAVNISARQFLAGDLDQIVAEALARHRVAAAHLELELTESMLVERPDEAAAMLRKLKGLGVELSLDDFGTGYSSFAYLSRFPIDTLKIDQSFIRDLQTRADAAMIADAIIGLAHRMRLVVVAEGVETAEQLDYLRGRGCHQMQGYYFSRPVPADAFAEMVTTGRALPAAGAAPV